MMVSHDVAAVPLYGGLIAHNVPASCAFVPSGPCASLPLDVRSRRAASARGSRHSDRRVKTVTAVAMPPAPHPLQFAVFLLVTDTYRPFSVAA